MFFLNVETKKEEEYFQKHAVPSVKIVRGPLILQGEYKRIENEKLFKGAIFEYRNVICSPF